MKKLFVTLLISSSVFAGETMLCPNRPGSSSRDYTQGCLVIQKDGTAYQTSPGSSSRDYTKPSFTLEKDGTLYQNRPGSSSKDYTQPTYKIEKK